MTITNAAIRAMQTGATLHDDVVDGLQLRFTGRRKTFYLYFRAKDGTERRPKLDHWGNITLQQARDAAREMRTQIAAGRDPVAERLKAKAEPTVAEFFDRVYDEHWAKRKGRAEVRRLYDLHVAPRVGSARVRAVLHDDVARIHSALSDTPYQANRVLALCSRLFNLASWPKYGLRVPGDNPCRGVERYAELKRRRKAEPAELARLGPILEREAQDPRNHASVAHLYLLAYSGARPSEIANAVPEQLARVDVKGERFGILELPGKTGHVTVVLPPRAMAVIDRLPVIEGQTITGIKSPKKLWDRIRREAGCPDLRMRDWRRTFASVALSRVKASKDQIGALLNHASTQTTDIYAKLYSDEAQVVAADTADRLAGMMRPALPAPT